MLFRGIARRRNRGGRELESFVLSGDLLWFGVALIAAPIIATVIGWILF